MKRIAVIGCSFSDYYQDKNLPEPVKTWSEWMADDNPDVHVDNYACSGHSLAYVEFVLKYIRKYRNDYHAVMFNIPPLPRSWMPTAKTPGVSLSEHETWFTPVDVANNYTAMTCNISRINLVSETALASGYEPMPRQELKGLAKIIGKESDGMKIPNALILDSIDKYYAKEIPNLIYWSHEWMLRSKPELELTELAPFFHNHKGNLSDTNKHVIEFLIDKYGEQYTAEFLMTDSAHLSSLGNQLMYTEFLLPNQNVMSVLKH